jgi:hypothetical protein
MGLELMNQELGQVCCIKGYGYMSIMAEEPNLTEPKEDAYGLQIFGTDRHSGFGPVPGNGQLWQPHL